MKKLLFGGILALAVIGLISAKGNGEGLEISGAVSTGLRFDAVGGGDTWQGPARNDAGYPKWTDTGFWQPTFGLWHDDAGNRFALTALYNKRNYGLKSSVELNGGGFNDWDPGVKFVNLYGWFELLDSKLRFTVGRIDDSVWNAPGAEDFNYSTGLGLRFEAKPMDGLNVGLFLRPAGPNSEYWGDLLTTWSINNKTPTPTPTFIHPDAKGDVYSRFGDALLETSFGAKYENDIFVAAAGLKLASEATKPRTLDWSYGLGVIGSGDLPNSDVGSIGNGNVATDQEGVYNNLKGVGFALYAGFGLKMVDNLTAELGFQLANLGAFNKYGWVWITQKVAYDMHPMSFGLNGHQKILAVNVEGADDIHHYVPWIAKTKDLDKFANAHLEFVPWFTYALNEKTDVGIDVPLKFQPGSLVNIDLGLKPRISYKFGDNFNISAYYIFNVTAFNGEVAKTIDSEGNSKSWDPLIRNAIQLNLVWSF